MNKEQGRLCRQLPRVCRFHHEITDELKPLSAGDLPSYNVSDYFLSRNALICIAEILISFIWNEDE